ncbi:hypothetical protein [Curtobacterium sp. MCBD17_028]|uniref:hypothetical protein n=1 Tax=Curtobacterium sp. MCBD17_028 TaxID=2175670 RepID=UPI000DA91D00|nr:hypothetical protein [Curtobacterium sp. MCBD17_028]PZE29744.1 hypothetical protein DEI86_00065 [Curtobacterium sp. MCBD17_028]
MRVAAGIVFVTGLAALVLGGWCNAVTADDGGGANIGAGVLMLFGGVVAATGAVMLLVMAVVAVTARTRGEARDRTRRGQDDTRW